MSNAMNNELFLYFTLTKAKAATLNNYYLRIWNGEFVASIVKTYHLRDSECKMVNKKYYCIMHNNILYKVIFFNTPNYPTLNIDNIDTHLKLCLSFRQDREGAAYVLISTKIPEGK
jgi:hypothetical protein